MPGEINAGQLVSMVRDELQVWNMAVLRSGFPDDPADDDGNAYTSTSILTYLNEAQRQLLLRTGYAKCRNHISISPQTGSFPWEFLLNDQVGKIVDVVINGNTLSRTTIGRMDLVSNGWQDTTSQVTGVPTSYYTIGDIIGFIPTPDQAYTVDILSDTTVSDLTTELSVPQRIPVLYMHGLVARCALDLNDMIELENPLSERRIARLNAEWTLTVEEVMKIVNSRGDDYQDGITVYDPRVFFMRGVAS